MTQIAITTIKPTSSLFATYKPRSKEGQPEKQALYISYEIPAAISNMMEGEIKAFAVRAYGAAMDSLLRAAIKDSKQVVTVPPISELFAASGKEYLITSKELGAWISTFALSIIQKAIAAKAGISTDSPKVIKRAAQYGSILEGIASRTLMNQDNIDACLRVLDLILASGLQHPYTENVAAGIARKQDKLNAYLEGKQEAEDELDF